MSKISTWSTSAASNNSAAPDGFPEGMTPGSVNNAAREVMASIRTQHEDAQWIDFGHTTTHATSTTFTVATDVTGIYDVGRRVKCVDSSTLYGRITASSYSNPNTTITVVLDSGSLSVSLTSVSVGVLSGQNQSIPAFSDREGTWTPTVTDSNGAATITTTTQAGRYFKFGNMVQVMAYIVVGEVTGTATGHLYVNGLPFATTNGSDGWVAASVIVGVLSGATANTPTAQCIAGSNTIFIADFNGTTTTVMADHVQLGTIISLSASYRVA